MSEKQKIERYSNKLKQLYTIEDGCIIFADKVLYNHSELKRLKDFTDKELKYIHKIKKRFRGIIL